MKNQSQFFVNFVREYLLGERRGLPRKVVCDAFYMNCKDFVELDEFSFIKHFDFTEDTFSNKSKFVKSSISGKGLAEAITVSERPVVFHPALPFLYCQPEFVVKDSQGRIGLCLVVEATPFKTSSKVLASKEVQEFVRFALLICSADFASVSVCELNYKPAFGFVEETRVFEAVRNDQIQIESEVYEKFRGVLSEFFEHVFSIKLLETDWKQIEKLLRDRLQSHGEVRQRWTSDEKLKDKVFVRQMKGKCTLQEVRTELLNTGEDWDEQLKKLFK